MNESVPTEAPPTPLSDYYERRGQDGIKDTFESIIVALILAFVFRAFIVEAFVIPTGSMAPTLYGAHGTILCEDCGTEFAYGLRDLDDPRHSQPVRSKERAFCPNCNHPNTDLRVSDDQMNPERGDRILVLKWPLDLGGPLFRPARWDVTVFKDPSDGVTNFIKRLVGLPNEALTILQGDVFTVPVSELSTRAVAELDSILREKYEFRQHLRPSGLLRNPSPEVLAELDQKLRIPRKTVAAQEALWFDVYDHDRPPVHWDANQPRWHAPAGEKSGWDASSRVIRFTNRGVPQDDIELMNGNFSATTAYNVFERVAPLVQDHRVSFVWTPRTAEGWVGVRLGKLGRHFLARISVDGSVRIDEVSEPPQNELPLRLAGHVSAFVPGMAVKIAFENVDYRLALHIDGEEALASTGDRRQPGYYGPDVQLLRTTAFAAGSSRTVKGQPAVPPRILGGDGDFDLLHVLVERDVHYFNESKFSLNWAPRDGWGSSNNPILLRQGEYFMLGDNTAASKDSRLWDVVGPHLQPRGAGVQLGTVPEDQLIGKAFFVYWPSGHRIDWLPVVNRVGVIPDVGRMRWIR